jgi:large subunit ribosomal protein L25
VSDKIEHADFLAVDEKSVVKVFIPLHFKNVEKSPGIKRGGVFNVERHSLELLCPVKAIPAFIEIDVGTMEIGTSIHTSNMALPQGVTPAVKGRDLTIASIAGRKEEKEEVAVAAPAAGAVPASNVKAPEGAAAAPAAAGGKAAAAPAAGAAKAPAGKDKK